jgi:hypothetical protein
MNAMTNALLETLTNMVKDGKASGHGLTFTKLTNGIDDSIEILMNDQTGYYNITNTATLISMLESGGNSRQNDTRGKRVNDWFRTKAHVEQINKLSEVENIPDNLLIFSVLNGEKKYYGTYIHPLMYDQFMQWLSPQYAVLVSKVLKEFHYKANAKLLTTRA